MSSRGLTYVQRGVTAVLVGGALPHLDWICCDPALSAELCEYYEPQYQGMRL